MLLLENPVPGVDTGLNTLEKTMKFFNAKERARQKQAARDKDDADLKAGIVSREELQKRN